MGWDTLIRADDVEGVPMGSSRCYAFHMNINCSDYLVKTCAD